MKVRLTEVAAIGLIGDGVVGLLLRRRHVNRWRGGPPAWRRMMKPFAERPQLTRAAGTAEVLVGLVVAARLGK